MHGGYVKIKVLINGGRIIFLINSAGTIGYPEAKKKKNLNLNPIPYTKINSKCIMDLNVKCKPTKLLEDPGENL